MNKYVLSTGVLGRAPRTVTAVVNLVNIARKSQEVEVEIWDWSSFSNPVKLQVLKGNNVPVQFPYHLSPGNLAVMYANLTGVSFYEIRIMLTKERNIIANCYGRSIIGAAQEGNTVLNEQLVRIFPNCAC